MGTKKERKALGYSVSTISNESVSRKQRRKNNKNLNRALQGKSAGIQITNSNGLSGSSDKVVIRGMTSNNSVSENEDYARIEENTFKNVKLAPLSTFSIDVDKAGYSNIRRMINNGQQIPQDAVKLEEMINYFSYNYKEPNENEPFSINTEIASSPWNSQTK